jgi:hypothetical protein
MFTDNVTDPFDYNECGKERECAESIRSQMTGIENSFDQEDPNLREKLMTLRDECSVCMGRIKDHQTKLGENYEQYQPNFSDVWANLAMKGDSYYHDDEPSKDEETKKFTAEQIRRVIPEGINDIFMNASLLPTLMRKENRKMATEFTGISESLKEDLEKMNHLIKNLPESPEKDEISGFLKGLLTKIGIDVGDSEDEGEEEGEKEGQGDVAGAVSKIVGDISQGNGGEEDEEDEDGDEDEGEEADEGREGGKDKDKPMYHLSFF